MTEFGLQRLHAGVIARHRHGAAYAALVLSGQYVEAGDRGRFRVADGDIVVHSAFEAHRNSLDSGHAVVLNLPLDGADVPFGPVRCDDPDEIVRLARTDVEAAAARLAATARPLAPEPLDWPDELARDLAGDAFAGLAFWAAARRLAPQSVSRGFRRVYGVSPKRYRREQRTLRALDTMPRWSGSIADLAAATGFADQAHFIHACRDLTGRTPQALRVQSLQEAARRAG